ncbi:pilus assembly protein N-terminal domain-containing protein [Proteiniphilum sp. UBA1028]|jgi:hypothetical protein|uniref:pilus assembly protein N-terminal domain-containing protein n=1 Tax=Proteiniphilum sp. UBA1028 TaxID=1947251 RepID=UPI0025D163A0|nr:pilus assembly protein N-terminal domain-containing protein [Proteiniphilum sp. UBA1028]
MNVKTLSYAVSIVLACILFVACEDDDKKVLTFTPSKVEVEVGKTATVNVGKGIVPYTANPADKTIATATVDKSTVTITGVKEGTTTITVTDKEKTSGKISVTVKKAVSLTFDKPAPEATVGATVDVKVSGGVAPYTVETKDATIATAVVAQDKITITGVKVGKTDIVVYDKDKKNSGTISVTIK